jgi:hypothetical protein
VPELQKRVLAISLRRLLKTRMQSAEAHKDQPAKERPLTEKGKGEPAEEFESRYLAAQEFEALSKEANLLGRLSQTEAMFLLETALERGTNVDLWFQKAGGPTWTCSRCLNEKL